jgi:hypothetical protein
MRDVHLPKPYVSACSYCTQGSGEHAAKKKSGAYGFEQLSSLYTDLSSRWEVQSCFHRMC